MNKNFLLILDGWGYRKEKEGNAILLANTPNFDYLMKNYPWTLLNASGESVGLPEGQMGNSEVGHLNIGSGRIVYQEITRINKAIKDGSFFKNKTLLEAMKRGKEKALHLMGLLSDGGVHSHQEHLYALLKMAKDEGVKNVYIHAFMDGRDTPPDSGKDYIKKLMEKIDEIGIGKIATISGRYYAMDRDKRWDRTKLAYDAMVLGKGVMEKNPYEAILNSYKNGITDEFIKPTVILENGDPVKTMENGESAIFFNFRADRARQITMALNEEDFSFFEREKKVKLHFFTFTEYEASFPYPICFPPETLKNILAEVLAQHKLKNLRIAETEKYAHVTFFFNGGVEKVFPGERRILIPSPKVATYDLKPEMSVYEITERLLKEIDEDIDDVFIINFANADMVGHTGVLEAAIKAIEAVDECLGKLYEKVKSIEGNLIVTADHGNADMMIDPVTKEPFTAHTTNPVPFILITPQGKKYKLKDGGALCDISPTLLELMKIEKPIEMTGESLILKRGT